ncbi:hypothetical protein GCM10027566_30260 [Arachidicoccus ginsenosidivorans]|jgi:predicted transposase YdaD|uniref:Uncharacterized protein n=1 Tax=Arachidicoccus ginsenosidivorans TaxID=496057 RepID=A0A5B8VMQ5_9BACT|nr:hypothetical protein [Arachidicoccus ginsenosidivorans]QEC72760.1 hypothetical protein FSB73_14835 [Arachidicoccus ginsenosidivorans]
MDAIENWKQRLRAEGKAEAVAVEREKAIGSAKAYFKVAIYLLKDGTLSLEEIAQVTTLDLDDIETLQKALQ